MKSSPSGLGSGAAIAAALSDLGGFGAGRSTIATWRANGIVDLTCINPAASPSLRSANGRLSIPI